MSYCHVSSQIDRYLSEMDEFDKRAEWITNRIAELTQEGADYYPYSIDAIEEALSELSCEQKEALSVSIKCNSQLIGSLINRWVAEYWELQAENKALLELK